MRIELENELQLLKYYLAGNPKFETAKNPDAPELKFYLGRGLMLTVFEKPIDKRKIDEEWWQMIVKQYQQYRADGVLDIHLPFKQWKLFEDNGIVDMPADEKRELFEMAKQLCKERAEAVVNNRRIGQKAMSEYSKAKSLLTSIEQGNWTREQENTIKSEAIQLAIERFYQQVSEAELVERIRVRRVKVE